MYAFQTYVKRPGSGDTEPAFATMQLMFMKGHFSGIPFNTYEDDRLMMYHNGGDVVVSKTYSINIGKKTETIWDQPKPENPNV